MRAAAQQVPTRAWFILFGDAPDSARAWWHRGLAPGYRHVMAVGEAGFGASVTVEHTGSHLLVDSVPMPPEELVLAYLGRYAVAHALRAEGVIRPIEVRPMLRPCMSCVEVVKALLGITATGIITPRQLARFLERRGARDVAITIPALAA